MFTVLSFGGGQDSTTLLYKLLHDPIFRKQYAPGRLVVVMADTKNEHPETYEHVYKMMKICAQYRVKFFLIDPQDGYHTQAWSNGLVQFYKDYNAIGSKTFPKTCTDQLKIRPIYKWLDEFIHTVHGYGKRNGKGVLMKSAIKEYAQKHGKIKMMIGIAKGEEVRVAKDSGKQKWMREAIENIYPLIDLGMDRQACIDYIRSIGEEPPIPSNCIICPFMNLVELLYLYRFHNAEYHRWVHLEQNKINNNTSSEKNFGVWGKKLLPEVLKEAQEKHGHMTNAELKEYRFSHGHCVKSAY